MKEATQQVLDALNKKFPNFENDHTVLEKIKNITDKIHEKCGNNAAMVLFFSFLLSGPLAALSFSIYYLVFGVSLAAKALILSLPLIGFKFRNTLADLGIAAFLTLISRKSWLTIPRDPRLSFHEHMVLILEFAGFQYRSNINANALFIDNYLFYTTKIALLKMGADHQDLHLTHTLLDSLRGERYIKSYFKKMLSFVLSFVINSTINLLLVAAASALLIGTIYLFLSGTIYLSPMVGGYITFLTLVNFREIVPIAKDPFSTIKNLKYIQYIINLPNRIVNFSWIERFYYRCSSLIHNYPDISAQEYYQLMMAFYDFKEQEAALKENFNLYRSGYGKEKFPWKAHFITHLDAQHNIIYILIKMGADRKKFPYFYENYVISLNAELPMILAQATNDPEGLKQALLPYLDMLPIEAPSNSDLITTTNQFLTHWDLCNGVRLNRKPQEVIDMDMSEANSPPSQKATA